MRRSALIDRIIEAGRSLVESTRRPTRRAPHRPKPEPAEPPARDIDARGLTVEYSPCMDGDPDQVRREGAVLARGHFDAVVEGVRRTGG